MLKGTNALVEMLFTSNAQILGVTGSEHPFAKYFRQYGLPTALSTDDEGVSHSNYTAAWLYAVLEYGLTYDDAVRLARFSLQYSFMPGDPLWTNVATAIAAAPCAGVQPGSSVAQGSACDAFLRGSARAHAQWDYETRLAEFTRSYGTDFKRYLASAGR